MRRGTMIAAVVLIALAGVGIGVGAYNAGQARGLEEQVQTIETTAPDGTEVVRVVGPGPGYGYGGWHGGHGGFFPFGFLLFPLFVIGTILLVRSFMWRGGGWGPRRPRRTWGTGRSSRGVALQGRSLAPGDARVGGGRNEVRP